jgi:hypothetical protein
MSGNNAPAGSGTYTSNTLHVGDGTWLANEDTFLLPNLMGFNFATMRFNGKARNWFIESEFLADTKRQACPIALAGWMNIINSYSAMASWPP